MKNNEKHDISLINFVKNDFAKGLKYLQLNYLELMYKVHLRIRYGHDIAYQKVNWYKKYSDKSYSRTINETIFVTFVLSLLIFNTAQYIFPLFNIFKPQKAKASTNTVTWTTTDDFNNNANTINTPTVKDGVSVFGGSLTLNNFTKVMDINTGSEINDPISGLTYRPGNNSNLAVFGEAADYPGDVHVIDTSAGVIVKSLPSPAGRARGYAWNSDGTKLAVGGGGGNSSVFIYNTSDSDPANWSIVPEYEIPQYSYYDAYPVFSSDNQYLAVGWAYHGAINIYRTSDWGLVKQINGYLIAGEDSWSADRSRLSLLKISDQWKVSLFDTSSLEPSDWSEVMVLPKGGGTSFSADSAKVSAGDSIYNVLDGTEFYNHNDPSITKISFSKYNNLENAVTYIGNKVEYFNANNVLVGATDTSAGYCSVDFAGSSSQLLIGCGNQVSLYRNVANTSGSISGLIFDAGQDTRASWNSVSLVIDAPNETTYSYKVRTADTTESLATQTWSGNFENISSGDISIVASARYIELQISLSTTDQTISPRVESVEILYNSVNAPDFSNVRVLKGDGFEIGKYNFFNTDNISISVSDVYCPNDRQCKLEAEVDPAGDFNGLNIAESSWFSGSGDTLVKLDRINNSRDFSIRYRLLSSDGALSAWRIYENQYGSQFTYDTIPSWIKIEIENGAIATKKNTVHLNIITSGDNFGGEEMVRFSFDGQNWTDWEDRVNEKILQLPSSGNVRVYAQVKDYAGNISGARWTNQADFLNNQSTYNSEFVSGSGDLPTSTSGLSVNQNNLTLTSESTDISSLSVSRRGAGNIAMDVNGALWANGGRDYGTQVGGYNNGSPLTDWKRIPLTGIKKYRVNCSSSFVLLNNGDLYAVGNNQSGEIANVNQGESISNFQKVQENVEDFYSGGHSVFVKKNDGSWLAMGDNGNGQLSLDNSDYNIFVWTSVALPSGVANGDIKQIEVNEGSTFLLTNDGRLYAVGLFVGDGFVGPHYIWSLVNTNIVELSNTQSYHIFAKKVVNDVVTWIGTGDNWSDKIPNSNPDYDGSTWEDVVLPGGVAANDIKRMYAGHDNSALLTNNNRLYIVGDNSNYNNSLFGINNANISVWTEVLGDVQDVWLSSDYSFVKFMDSRLESVGDNSSGSLAIGDTVNKSELVPVSKPLTYGSVGYLGSISDGVGLRMRWDKYNGGQNAIQNGPAKWLRVSNDNGQITGSGGFRFAVKTSMDGINWSSAIGRDGQVINWDSNYFGSNDLNNSEFFGDLSQVPESYYIEFVLRLDSKNGHSPVVNDFIVESAAYDEIVVDNESPTVAFDQNNKYPNNNWNVKENVNSIEYRFTTNKNTIAYIDYGKDALSMEAHGEAKYGTNHNIIIKNLNSSTKYKYKIRLFDDIGNSAVLPSDSGDQSIYEATTGSTNIGFDGLPQVSNLSQVEITASSAKITWKTKQPTSSWIEFGLDSSYGNVTGDDALNTNHVVELKNLTAGKVYHYRVKGNDANDNEFMSDDLTFMAVMKPSISNIKVEITSPYSAEVSWTTNVKTDSNVAFGTATPYSNFEKSGSMLTAHRVILHDLQDDVQYNYQIEAIDAFGNITKTENLNFKTILDTVGPKIDGVRVDILPLENEKSNAQAIVSWTTDKPATSWVQFDVGLIGGKYTKSSIEDKSLNFTHTVILKDLRPATTYRFKIVSKDKRENVTLSTDYNFITPTRQKSIWQLIVQSLEETFNWTKNVGTFWGNIGNRMWGEK